MLFVSRPFKANFRPIRSIHIASLFLAAVSLLSCGSGGGGGGGNNQTSQPPMVTPPAQNVPTIRISTDPFTNSTSQHQTQVEPDTFAFNNTIVAAFQSGRFFQGGASDIAFATSEDGGATWTTGVLPGITNVQQVGNLYDRVSDPSVAYDAAHKVWLIASLPLLNTTAPTPAVLVSRSSDGMTWQNPVAVTAPVNSPDKDWIVCDNTSTSPFYGHCYVEWDDFGNNNRINMNTSTDGGLTWGPSRTTADAAGGLGGQPLVQPNGNVIVPINNANQTTMLAFRSIDGGATWSATVKVADITDHLVAGNLRTSPLPSAEMDQVGNVYLVWQDCRFRPNCTANDLVLSTSADGVTWTLPTRVPIDGVNSTFDHFIPGLAVDRTTSGTGAHLALAYYFYTQSSCTAATCQLSVGFISSSSGGSTWTAPQFMSGPMSLGWLANTNQGVMVGDYISTSYVNGRAHPVFAVAQANSGTTFNEAMFTATNGLSAEESSQARVATMRTTGQDPVLSFASDHPPRQHLFRTF